MTRFSRLTLKSSAPDAAVNWEQLAQEGLAHFPVDAERVELISKAENISFFVQGRNSDRYVLRIHRPEYHTLDELISEQLWTNALLKDGLDVPIPVKSSAGDRYVQVVVSGGIRNVGLLEWVDGKPIRDGLTPETWARDHERVYEAIGDLLAKLHAQASVWRAPPEFTRHAFDADGLMGEQPFWGRFWEAAQFNQDERTQLTAMRDELYAVLAKLPKTSETFSLIHADLHLGNLIANDDSFHIIDFDDAGFGWHAYDFAVALSSAPVGEIRESAARAMFRGYARQRRLQPWVPELLPMFGVIRMLASIGWMEARPDLGIHADVQRDLFRRAANEFESVIEGANQTIANLQS